MNIKRVDDKPMVIHIRQKSKLHTIEPKKAEARGEVLTGKCISDMNNKYTEQAMKNYKRNSLKKSEKMKKGRFARYRQNMKDSKQSIKSRNLPIRIARAMGTNSILNQMEGGEEIKESSLIAYGALRPITGTAPKDALLKQKIMLNKKRKIKKVDAEKKFGKKEAKNRAKAVAKKTVRGNTKARKKVVTNTATISTGTSIASKVRTGQKDMQTTKRSIKLKYVLDKMNAQEQQKNSFAKIVKDLLVSKVSMWIKAVAPILGFVFLVLVVLIAIVVIPVIAVVAIIYNSPFAIFFPPLEDGDTVTTIASAYVAEFSRDVNTLANEHTGYDMGKIVYMNYEGMEENPTNYYDILAVYMVKYGVGDTATIMNGTSKDRLQNIVNDMCSYSTSTGTEEIEVVNEDGTTDITTKTCLYVNVTLKNYFNMISEYGFSAEEEEMLREFMTPEYLQMLE